MTWTKLSDDWPSRPELITASRSARLLHLEALTWSNRHGRDGTIPKRVLAAITDADTPDQLAAELVTSGAWEAGNDRWQIVDSLDDQPTSEEAERQRDRQRERQKRQRLHRGGDHSMCDPRWCRAAQEQGVTGDVTRDSRVSHSTPSRPDPTRPDPSRPDRREGEGRGRDKAGSADASGAGAPTAPPTDPEEETTTADITIVFPEERTA